MKQGELNSFKIDLLKVEVLFGSIYPTNWVIAGEFWDWSLRRLWVESIVWDGVWFGGIGLGYLNWRLTGWCCRKCKRGSKRYEGIVVRWGPTRGWVWIGWSHHATARNLTHDEPRSWSPCYGTRRYFYPRCPWNRIVTWIKLTTNWMRKLWHMTP